MTQEKKDLLIKDLCGRLPYGIKIMIDDKYLTEDMIKSGYDKIQELYGITYEGNVELLNMDYHMPVESIKPYLFPMSSMTEEQDKEYALLQTSAGNEGFLYPWNCANMVKWLIENHFDYNGLIPMGLAKDATNLDIY